MEVDRVVTIPNAITTVRLLMIPVFLWALFARDSQGWAAVILWTIGGTDWIDGYVARRFDMTSAFGAIYDPTVDRLMVVVSLVAVLIDGSVPLWFAWVVLAREVLVSLWVVVITAMGAKRMDVTWWGKVGGFANMVAIPWFLFAAEETFSDTVRDVWRVLAYCAAIPGVVFSVLAAGQYFLRGRQALREGRSAAASTAGSVGGAGDH